ncbi:MAG TPA: HAD family hydrolase [Blastocatellia bacterium]
MIKLVITDLDNTIYDWVDFYVPSFNAMVRELSVLTGLDEPSLRQSFKRVHQAHRTSEYAFSIEELDVLAEADRGLTTREILAKYATAIDAFRRTRAATLRLYPGVKETIEDLRGQGKKIVGHTDAMMFYAAYRVKQLGIERLFDGLVAPRDHGIPEGVSLEDVRSSDDPERYVSAVPVADELNSATVKPDPIILRKILNDFGVSPEEAVYVGDSLHKDIHMAQSCGVYDVFARYGRNYNPQYYRQLVEITHWTDEDVERELKLKGLNIKPTFVISSFPELKTVIDAIGLERRRRRA